MNLAYRNLSEICEGEGQFDVAARLALQVSESSMKC
jgi:hypothetical protein